MSSETQLEAGVITKEEYNSAMVDELKEKLEVLRGRFHDVQSRVERVALARDELSRKLNQEQVLTGQLRWRVQEAESAISRARKQLSELYLILSTCTATEAVSKVAGELLMSASHNVGHSLVVGKPLESLDGCKGE